jgi:hypothetical protein
MEQNHDYKEGTQIYHPSNKPRLLRDPKICDAEEMKTPWGTKDISPREQFTTM